MKGLSQFPFLRGEFVAHQFPKDCCGHGSKAPRLPLVYVLPSPCLSTRFSNSTASISLGTPIAVLATEALTAAALKLKRQHSANPIPQRSNWRRLCQAALSEFSLDGRHEGTTKRSGEGTTLAGQEGTHGYETDDLFYSLQLGIILASCNVAHDWVRPAPGRCGESTITEEARRSSSHFPSTMTQSAKEVITLTTVALQLQDPICPPPVTSRPGAFLCDHRRSQPRTSRPTVYMVL